MKAALRGSYIEFVIFAGDNELYPMWFAEEIYDSTFTDESRFTFWVCRGERRPDYYEKQLIEEYSVILKKPTGELHVTSYEAFTELYSTFVYCEFLHCGIAALRDDCIEYVDIIGGRLPDKYPDWFYEYYTESVNFSQEGETILINNYGQDQVSVTKRCVFLRNKLGEIRGMDYDIFLKYYDPSPQQEENFYER